MDLAEKTQERGPGAEPSLCAGRDAELMRIRALYDEAAENRTGRVAVDVAPPGVGKSRLLAETLRRFRAAGVPVFDGRCRPGGVAYEPFIELAQSALTYLSDQGASGATLARASEVAAALRGQTPASAPAGRD